jgi:hypothetical protein
VNPKEPTILKFPILTKAILCWEIFMNGMLHIVRTKIKHKKHHIINMGYDQNNKRTFTHFHWCIDSEDYEWCFLLLELKNGTPIACYIVPVTKPYLKCHIYPFIRN